jgi:hypothetical protein
MEFVKKFKSIVNFDVACKAVRKIKTIPQPAVDGPVLFAIVDCQSPAAE